MEKLCVWPQAQFVLLGYVGVGSEREHLISQSFSSLRRIRALNLEAEIQAPFSCQRTACLLP